VAYRIKYFAPATLYILLILGLSSLNQNTVSRFTWELQDFILHAIEYNLFGVTLIWATLRDKPWHELKASYRLAVSLGSLFGILDEFYQSFIPSRYSSVEDVAADVFGVILSIVTFSLLMKIPYLKRLREHA